MNQFSSTIGNGQGQGSSDHSRSPIALKRPSSSAPSLTKRLNGARVAIVHHWFLSRAGGERVFDVSQACFPSADVFTLFLDKKFLSGLHNHKITTSFLDKIPAAQKVHRHLLPFYPLAVEMLDLHGYDLVISSDAGPVKGVLTNPGSTHICYCHSPMRYLWDGRSTYHRTMSPLTRSIFGITSHYVRNWDYSAAQRVDHFVANSTLCGHADSQVLPPEQHRHSSAD